MSNTIAVIEKTELVRQPVNANDLARAHFGRELDESQWKMFLYTANTLGLSIASKQIYAILRNDKAKGAKVMTIQIGIDGARAVAARSGKLGGISEPQWCADDGIWRSIWVEKKPPSAARVTVYRNGASHGFTGVAMYNEFCQRTADGNPSNLWHTMPAVMLRKCAESQALRMAFPHELQGVYTEEEMQQADNVMTDDERSDLADALDAIAAAGSVDELLGPVKNMLDALKLKGAVRLEVGAVYAERKTELQSAAQRDTAAAK